MKISVVYFILTFCSFAKAEQKYAESVFWRTPFQDGQIVLLEASNKNILAQDCKRQRDSDLPVAGSMRDQYRAEFSLKAILVGRVIEIDLKHIDFFSRADVNLVEDKLIITSRALVCELILERSQLLAQADYLVGVDPSDIIKLNDFFERIAEITTSVKLSYEESFQRAVAFSFRYSRLYDHKKPALQQYDNFLRTLYRNLFKASNFQLSSDWKKFGEHLFFDYPKWIKIKNQKIILKVQ